MNKKIIYLLFAVLSLAFAAACSSDDDDNEKKFPAETVQGTYKGDLTVKVPAMDNYEEITLRKIILTATGNKTVKFELKEFSFSELVLGDIVINDVEVSKSGDIFYIIEKSISVELNGGITADVTVSGTIAGKAVELIINVTNTNPSVGDVDASFVGTKMDADNENTEALITAMAFASEVVVVQPVIDGTNIYFYVKEDATDEELAALVPAITVSEGATVDPESGKAIDFSAGSVTFTVTAQDSIHKNVYNVSWQRYGKYDFEDWSYDPVLTNPESLDEDKRFYAPVGGWGSSNPGVQLLKTFGLADKYCVTQSGEEDAYSGKSAARIETIDTQGKNLIIAKVPKVTTGSLFLGTFSANLQNTLSSTKFGIPYSQKPLKMKGYYKYTPGAEFYRATGQDDCHLATLEEGTVDKCAINAILYEIESDNDDYLTGENAYTSEKIAAIAQLQDGSAKENYTSFEIDFEYKKPYDSAKKYRFAIICSSSSEGATFSGAPGSVLYVDDIEVISE